MNQTNEHAFETYVEEILLTRGGWKPGSIAEWDKERAMFPAQVFAFIADTQPKLWQAMRDLHAAGLEALMLTTLVKELDAKGSLHVLRHGFKFYGKTFRLAYFKPAHGANFEVLELFDKNRLTVTHQVPCHPGDNRTLDMVLAVNGLPVSTIELKNPGTGQNWRHAVRQYKEDRDPHAPLFEFKKRALVHFAADSEEVHMTTRLAGERTYFLPFNRGSHPGKIICGAGNPQHKSGYRTGYFWEDVLQFQSFMDILGHFMFLEKKEEKADDGRGGHRVVTRETMIFPRYHQLESVREMVRVSRVEGPGFNYLIIVDEAHSSQTGETARELKAILGEAAKDENPEEEPDWEDRLNQVMLSRGRQPNLSFFAFTATPKGKTLELFGRKGESGLPEAFHLYSMRQAIEEEFILDVVKNYTTYATYYRLVKAIEDDPNLPKKKAARALAKFMSLHPHNIEQKTEVMVEHFRHKVRGHLGGQAKAMVVTSSRHHAVRYMQAFQRYIKEHNITDVRPLVAFSGTVKDPDTGIEYTEPGMNPDCVSAKPIGEKQLPERFASPDYQVFWWRTNTRPALISPCFARCMWTNGLMACRPCRRCRA